MLSCQMTYSSDRQQDLTHSNLLIFLSYLSIKEVALNLYIFESMLKIFTMLAHREQSILRQHDKDPQYNGKNVHDLFGVFVCIFDSMLKIFITSSNRELSICNNVRKILNLMTKICMVFFGVFVCLLVLKLKTGEGVFIEVLGCCEPHKLLLQCGPYKRILC